jgi:hypothetical protein
MENGQANDLRAFRRFVDEKLSNGGATLTLDEALDLWDYENASEEEREATLASIRRGLDDMHAGRTVDAFDFVERMRQKLSASDYQ